MHTRYRDEEDRDTQIEDREGDLLIRNASQSSENGYPIPVWMRESAKSFKYKWIPLPLRKAGHATARWIKGPVPSVELHITPFYPNVQEAPLRWMDKYLPRRRHRISLLIAFYAVWFLTWSLMLRHNQAGGYIVGYGKPSNIWCGASFWQDGSGCGQNGHSCRPFSSAHLTFNCPANCRATRLLEPHIVGNESYVYQELVVGGPDPSNPAALPVYRGDSFICQAAIHAGVISNDVGGCGVATLTGTHSNFHASEANGIRSIAFPSTFPRTFTFQSLSQKQSQCPTDTRWPLLLVTAIALTLLWLFTASPSVLFLSTFFILALHVGLVADPPITSNFHELLSIFFSRLLPASFISFILCRYCAIPTLTGLHAQIEKPVLYLTFTFIGALNNYTFARLIPLQRLTPHDIKSQPGAPIALAIVIGAILTIVITQIYFIRISGKLPGYLKLYATFLLGLFILLVLPGWRLRIHHYILALLFLPGTAMQTRPAMIYQGLLLGLFINGVMRWGFDSIIQTPTALGEVGGAQGGSWWGATWPVVNATTGHDDHVDSIHFEWGNLPRADGVDGVSILVDDVERWRGYIDEELYWHPSGVTLARRGWMKGDEAVSSSDGYSYSDTRDNTISDAKTHYNYKNSNSENLNFYHHQTPTTTTRSNENQNIINLDKRHDKDSSNSSNNNSDNRSSNKHNSTTSPPPRLWSEPDFYRFAWLKGNTAGRYGGVGIWDEWGRWSWSSLSVPVP